MEQAPDYQPIENYGIVGDLNTVALVGMNGSIDFMCMPRFDSPSVFCSLLDKEKGGRFMIAPVLGKSIQRQHYLYDTNILLSRFLSDEGVAEITDFMPIQAMGHSHDLVRIAKTIKGEVHFRLFLQPRFNYARSSHKVETGDNQVLFLSEGSDKMALRLRTSVPVKVEDGCAVAEFCLRAGESAAFIIEHAIPGRESPSSATDYANRALEETVRFWRGWMGACKYRGRWREVVYRSALTLKLLTWQPGGSLVAAPTFGLPERIGGRRNWDYRFNWIRDASFTLYALIRLGYTHEMGAFMAWIEARCNELDATGSLQNMYRIDGGREMEEITLDHLEGYKGSKPVRIGNAAAEQLQLDIYGELMDSVYLYNKYGEPISYDLWRNLVRLLDWLSDNWRQPDAGIWEVRSGNYPFCYSRLMCWVAFDRGLRLAAKRSFPAPIERWTHERDSIYREIMDCFYDHEIGAFVQYQGSKRLDASCLVMPLMRFVGATDPRWISTMRAIERSLVSDSHVYRYNNNQESENWDGFPSEEGTFCMCSFWFVECLSRMGEIEKARYYFEKMLGYANHLGLYAEELGMSGEHLGNFPQGFTHLALISAAYDLDRRLTREGPGD